AQVNAKAAAGEAAFTANTGTFGNTAAIDHSQQDSADAAFKTSAVNATNDTITLTTNPFHEGDQVVYSAGSHPIRGLTSGSRYFVHIVSGNTIQLRRLATDNTPIDLIASTATVGPGPNAEHNLDSVTSVGTPSVTNDNWSNSDEIVHRAGTDIVTED